jgi:Domain of unknown function (DUF4390)
MFLKRRRDLLQRSASALLAACMAQAGWPARADTASRSGLELSKLAVQRNEDGLLLSYDVRFDMPRDIEQALGKGIAVVFVAEATLFRDRWYWIDEVRTVATRRWRLAYQPLTRQWRLSFDGLSRHYVRLGDALDALRRTNQWRIADALPTGDTQDYYVDFSFKLDTDELPRPLQIGLGGQSEWQLAVQRRTAVPPSR